MKDHTVEIAEQLGAGRVLDPPGTLPQRARRLDPLPPLRASEFQVSVERLCLDSTSFRQIREATRAEPAAMAGRIEEIVSERGKLHNPETDSGGVLLGTVGAVGEAAHSPPRLGERVVTLGSLTMTPLRLGEVRAVDPESPQVEVSGTAYVFDRAGWAPLPDDLPTATAIDLFDVCAAATQTEALAPEGGTVCVLGAGHAGKLALAAAREAAELLVAVDVDPGSIEVVSDAGLCDIGVVADLRDPLAALDAVSAAGGVPADLTVVVVNAPDCEPTALLLTRDEGTVLFFSMATNFSAAALAADGIGTGARMVVGSGYCADRGGYALELVRGSEPLRRAMGLEVREMA
jgi:L-erythro-3,5-diaminohexanoate dehydrogenase